MSVGYVLVNHTKREQVTFIHVPASTMRELAGNPVAAAITTWYLLHNTGDRIAFISDTYEDWPFHGEKDELSAYPDKTADVVQSLVDNGILRDDGLEWRDESEPDTVFMRSLKNIWISGDDKEGKST